MPEAVFTDVDSERFRAQFEQANADLQRAWAAALPGLRRMAQDAVRAIQHAGRTVHLWNPRLWHQNAGIRRRHCAVCTTRTLPLPIDGHALRRRQRARARKRR